VIFGKNSDRPAGEGQSVRSYPGGDHEPDTTLSCTYINIPQVSHTHAVLLSQIDWMFGAEMGANEHGVVIGNEAVWTVEPMEDKALLGMDLLRLGLERGKTAREALDVITTLLERHGQGGPCAENDASFTYHNSFLIVDVHEAWVLETAGRHWAAERIQEGARNISNGLTIRTKFDLSSKGLKEYAREKGLWDGKGEFDFARCFSDGPIDASPNSRQKMGEALMEKHKGSLDSEAMMDILRNHESGICMHGGFETTASMVSELRANGVRHWMTGEPYPCKSSFRPQNV
jgi:secernin